MNGKTVYVALQGFCEKEDLPRQMLVNAGFQVRQNTSGRRLRREEMSKTLQDVDAVLAGVEPYDAKLLDSLPRLRCISRCGVGTDTIDMEAAQRRRIAVLTTPEEATEAVAQMTLAMILALARNLSLYTRELTAQQWTRRMGHLLSEWTIGLVGFGRIGRAVERRLRPLGSTVLVADPNFQPKDLPVDVALCELGDLLSRSDLVSLHASRRPAEGALIGQAELRRMKPGSYLVNTARGHLVDETALKEALDSGHLAGAALDVFEEEPYAGPLSRLPNVLCTPHVAALTRTSRAAMERRCAENVVRFFQEASP